MAMQYDCVHNCVEWDSIKALTVVEPPARNLEPIHSGQKGNMLYDDSLGCMGYSPRAPITSCTR